MNATTTISIVTRIQALLDHPLIKRGNFGWTLQSPFSWSIINTAATLARQLDKLGYCAEHLELQQGRRDELLADPEFNAERADQLLIKLATLRHWNRELGTYEIGMGAITQCLRPSEDMISIEEIKTTARERIKIERRMGRLKADAVSARFQELVSKMWDEATERKRQLQRLLDEVFFIANRCDSQLFVGDYERNLETNISYDDADLVDVDAHGHMLEGLLEKCVEPLIRAREELQRVMDRSYRESTLRDGNKLLAEIEKLGKEVGINFTKIERMNAEVDAALDGAESAAAVDDAAIDALDFDPTPDNAPDNTPDNAPAENVTPIKPKRTRVKAAAA